MLKPPRQQITGHLCNHSGHQEMRIIYTGTSWGCAIKSHLSCLEIIPLLCPGNLCQSVGGAALPSPVPLSSSAALNLCGQRFADASAQRHTCHVSCALSFPASLDTTSLRIHFSVPSNYPLLRQELGDKLRCDWPLIFQNRISYCLVWVFWKIIYFLCYMILQPKLTGVKD